MRRDTLRTLGRAIAIFLLAFAPVTMAIEEAPYKPIETQGSFELREYAPYVVAETYVEGEFDSVGNEGFRRTWCAISAATTAPGRPSR